MDVEAMTEHDFVLKLEAPRGAEPEVRLWVDDQQTCHLGSEQGLELVRTGSGKWIAAFRACATPIMYRIGLVAAPGIRWPLTFRIVGEQPEELLDGSDELAMPKEWLIGTCDDSASQHRARDWCREAS